MNDKHFFIKITSIQEVETFAGDSVEAIQKAKEILGLNEKTVKDVKYSVKIVKQKEGEKVQTEKLPLR